MSWKKKGSQKRKRVNEITTDGASKGSKIDKSLKPLETATKRSQKSQRINRNLITKLHVLTNVEEKVLAAPTPGRVTGVKNCNVWNFKIAALHGESCLKHGAVTPGPFISKATVLPSQEKLRHRCVTESRDYLKNLCKDHGVIPPLMAWERWQSNSILQQQLTHRDRDACDIVTFNSSTNNYCRKITVDGEHSTDPMLPSEVQEPDEGLIQDLLRGGVNDIDAIKIASETTVHSKKMADKIQAYILTCFVPTQEIKTTGNKKKQRKQLLQRNQAIANTDLQPTVIDHKHSYDIYLGDKSKHVLKLNNAYYGKLRELYLLNRSQNQCSTTPSRSAITNVDRADTAVESTENSSEESVLNAEKIVPEKEEEDDIITKEFHSGLYVLLARYNALLGHGMQCALPEHVFQTLHEHTQTNFECFASPLNCRYSSYCSAFPDTDGIFGSKGSFFDFYPTSGSYEVNPPFIESIMVASVDHSHKLLTDSSDGLSFVFIIPGTNTICYQRLRCGNVFVLQ